MEVHRNCATAAHGAYRLQRLPIASKHGTFVIRLCRLFTDELISRSRQMNALVIDVSWVLILRPGTNEIALVIDAELPLNDIGNRALTRAASAVRVGMLLRQVHRNPPSL